MTTSEASDDPFEIHTRREPLQSAGIRIILLTDLDQESAEAVVAPLVEQISALGREVERCIVPVGGSDFSSSLARGLEGAHLPLVLTTTAQEPWTKAHLDPLLEGIDHSDHVVGRRPAGGWDNGMRWLGALPRRLVFAVPLLDIHSPCRLHRLEKLSVIPLQSASSFLDTEILAKATFLGQLIAEADVPPLRRSPVSPAGGRIGIDCSDIRNSSRSSGPAEEPQCQHESPDGPDGEDRQGGCDVGESRPFEDDPAQSADQLREGQGLDQRLDARGEPVGREEDPGTNHIGNMTRFMSPLTVSVVVARDPTRRPIPAKASAPKRSITMTRARLPRIGMWNINVPSKSRTVRSGSTKVNRAPRSAIRKSRRGMGVATNLLSSLAIRKLTTRKPMPHSPPPMALSPIRPGIRKSI